MLPIEEYLALRERPKGRAAMRQTWLDLTFLHFRVEPAEIQATLPIGLTVDTYPDEDGKEWAYVGLVPFRMSNIRFEGTPAVPGCHAFPETNVRTYAHRDGKEPGVWFYSLDAANPFACAYARRFFGLPYHPARMVCRRAGDVVSYETHRRRSTARLIGEVTLGKKLPLPGPETLDFFLVERYLLYSQKDGRFATGRVFHPPYDLTWVESFEMDETMVASTGLSPRPWCHQVFSAGVSVEVFSLLP